MKKVLTALVAFSVASTVSCGNKNDELDSINNRAGVAKAGATAVTEGEPTVTTDLKKAVPAQALPLGDGSSVLKPVCPNPVTLNSRASEKDLKNLTDLKGDLQLESLLFFTESWMKTSDTKAHLVGQWINDRAYVTCHSVSATSSQLDSVFTIPLSIDYQTKKITAEGRLDLQARGGQVGAQFLVTKTNSKLPPPAYNKNAPKGIVSNLVRTVDGKAVLRLNFKVKDKRGNGYSEFWAEATYSVKPEALKVAKPKAPAIKKVASVNPKKK